MIDFAQPAMLIGLLAAALPLALHLLGRRRARPVAFTALAFLMTRDPRRSRALRLRERALLLVRCLVAAAIAFALAKPLIPALDSRGAVIAGSGPVALVVVLDDSMSMMQMEAGGQTRFDLARRRVLGLLERLPPGSTAALVASGYPARALGRGLSADLRAAAQAVRRLVHWPRRDDAGRAIALAQQLLASAGPGARGLVVVSDLQASGWQHAALPSAQEYKAGGPVALRVQVERIGGPAVANTAIVAASAEPAPERGPQQVRVLAEISHRGPTPFQGHVTVRAGEREVKSWVEVAPGDTIKRSFVLPATTDTAEILLPDDGLAADNRRFVRLSGGDLIRVGLVDGAPRPVPREDEVFFAARALQIGAARAGAVAVDILQLEQLKAGILSVYDVIVLANVGELSPLVERELLEQVKRGGGLLISAGDAVPEQADRWLPILQPGEVVGHHRIAAARRADVRSGPRLQLMQNDDGASIAVTELRARLAESMPGLGQARIAQHLQVRPSASLAGRTVLALDSGAPILLLTARGRGQIALLTTAIDRDWSDLPLQPGYLPLLQELVATLAGRPGHGQRAAIEPAGVAVLTRHEEAERLEVRRADGDQAGELVRALLGTAHRGRSWQVDGLLAPGRYLARELGKGGRWSERSILVVPPESESSMAVLPEQHLVGPASSSAPKVHPKVPGWSYALIGLMLLLVVEGALLVRSSAPA